MLGNRERRPSQLDHLLPQGGALVPVLIDRTGNRGWTRALEDRAEVVAQFQLIVGEFEVHERDSRRTGAVPSAP